MKHINNLKKIEIFKEVVSAGSISSAAARLGLSQPAVSSSIANLESDLGFSLFKRTRGGTSLTPEALHLVTAAEELLNSANNFHKLVHELRFGRAGKIYIGCMPGFPSTLVPKIVSKLILDNPDLSVSLKTCDSERIHEGIRSGLFDIGIAELPYNENELKVQPMNFELVVILPSSHPLREKEEITIADLDQQPFITLDEHHFLAHEIKNKFIKAQCQMNVVAEAHLFSSIAMMVSEGLGLSLVDIITAKKIQHDTDDRIVIKPFKPESFIPLGILLPTAKHLSKSVRLLNEMFEEELQQLATESC